MAENDKIVNKTYTDPVTGKFAPGNPGGGRPKGSEDFKTKWFRFVEKVATSNNMTAEEIDEQLLAVGFKKAKEGDFQFYKDIHDRIYGRAPQTLDLTTKGEALNADVNNPQARKIAEEYEEKLKKQL